MNPILATYIGTLSLTGWVTRKLQPYGERNSEPETGLQVLSMVPIGPFIAPPIIFGYYMAEQHDNLLYKMYPKFYQKKIDIYLESRPKWEFNGRTGNPQITF